MLMYTLPDLQSALRSAEAILAAPPESTDADDYADTLDVLAHFAPLPEFPDSFDWLPGCCTTAEEKVLIARTARMLSWQWAHAVGMA